MIVSNKTKSGKDITTVSKWRMDEQVLVQCDMCEATRWLSYAACSNNLNRTGLNRCRSCATKVASVGKNPNIYESVRRAAALRVGEKHASWRGGIIPTSDGYLQEWVPPEQRPDWQKAVYRKRGILVAEKMLGRKLNYREFVVHHIDGDKLNDEWSNLAVIPSQSHHRDAHQSLQEIGYELVKAGYLGFDTKTHRYVAHTKFRELLGLPETDNQQPSLGSDALEGSETRSESDSDDNSPTSAGRYRSSDDIVRTARIIEEKEGAEGRVKFPWPLT